MPHSSDLSRSALAHQLREAGHVRPTGTQGLSYLSQDFTNVVTAIQDWWLSLADAVLFPPLLGYAQFTRTDYVRSFPNLAGTVNAFLGGDAEHRQLLSDVERGDDWRQHFEPSDMVLVPAACEQVYPLYQDHDTVPRNHSVSSWCFRHEPSDDPMRQVAFRMAENVHIGTPETLAEFLPATSALLQNRLEELGLRVAKETANDPFFGRAGKLMARQQMDEEAKLELLVELYPGAPTAIGSVNCHAEHFSSKFNITVDGELAHSGCVAIGLERAAIALFARHGMELEQWPAEVREILGC